MKRFIKDFREGRFAYIFVIVGILLVAFPSRLEWVAPTIIGALLILYSLAKIIIYVYYKNKNSEKMTEINLGKSFVYLIIGAAITHQRGDAIGVIGSMWAMVSLMEASEEINQWLRRKEFSLFHTISIIFSTVFALLLLFDPFEHFNMHMRILGIEMILSIFERSHNKAEICD